MWLLNRRKEVFQELPDRDTTIQDRGHARRSGGSDYELRTLIPMSHRHRQTGSESYSRGAEQTKQRHHRRTCRHGGTDQIPRRRLDAIEALRDIEEVLPMQFSLLKYG
jgi:hypothetical protein